MFQYVRSCFGCYRSRFLLEMADLPSKRLRQDKNVAKSRNSTMKKNGCGTSTLVDDNSAESQSNAAVSRNGTEKKQATIDRYLSKKLVPKAETVSRPITEENENAVAEAVPETSKCEPVLLQEVETACNQASGNETASEARPETQKCESTEDTDATVATLQYDSELFGASQYGTEDNVPTETSDSSPVHLELGEISTASETVQSLPPLCRSTSHAVLFIPDTADPQCTGIPKPFPRQVVLDNACWDNNHVRLPYSSQNKLLVNKTVVDRWGKIVSSLSAAKWNSSDDIEKTILSYNKYKWDFTELHRYFQMLTEEEHDLFFGETLPKVAELAVNLPSVCTQPIPLLRKQNAASISMTQHQAACLLANAFFCTFPSRNMSSGSDVDVPRMPSINFNNLYRRASVHSYRAQHAKLDCLLHYFRRVTTDMPSGTLTFARQVIHEFIQIAL